MDEAQIRQVVETHADAVVDPMDMARVQGDLIEELHPGLPALAQALPTPVTSATVDALDVADDHAIAQITYTGAQGSVTIQSRWEDRGADQPQIVEAAPV